MANVATFMCKYLVVNTGYTERLLNRIDDLNQFCTKHGIECLGIYDHTYGKGITCFPYVNGQIDLSESVTSDEMCSCIYVVNTLAVNNLQVNGSVIFRVDTFDKATDVFLNISELGYCSMGNIMQVKLICTGISESDQIGTLNTDPKIMTSFETVRIAYVEIDAESG